MNLYIMNKIISDVLMFLLIFVLEASTVISDTDIFDNSSDDAGFTIRTSGCTLSRMELVDYTIKDFIRPFTNLTCLSNRHPLLRRNETHIWVVPEHYPYYGIDSDTEFECFYTPFHHMIPSSDNFIYTNVDYLKIAMFNKVIKISDEFVKVTCKYIDELIYEDVFIFVPKKPFTIFREKPFSIPSEKPAYNVIVLGMSSMSRLNVHRSMPKTMNLLLELGAVELLGYHSIAGTTFDNIMPILSGMYTNQLKDTCWSEINNSFDNCPFIWERFKDEGYYTALVEDTDRSGIFNTGSLSFKGNPTDYYLHPFVHEALNVRRNLPTLQDNEDMSICLGGEYFFRVILEYVDRLTTVLRSSKLFGIFWESSLTQRHLNAATLMDLSYEMLIRKLNEKGYLNETVLIVVSDQGIDHGGISMTKGGRLERRLPFASILVPPGFKRRYKLAYKNLKTNRKRLTTPRDIHNTLIDLLDLYAVSNKEILNRNESSLCIGNGVSLFSKVSSIRSCLCAGIESSWCACNLIIEIDINSQTAKGAVGFLVLHLNWLLMEYNQCEQLYIDKIIEVEEMWPIYSRDDGWREFKAVARLKPGEGVFEAILRYDRRGWSPLAHIRRLDEFVPLQHKCLRHEQLMYYCTCKRRLTIE